MYKSRLFSAVPQAQIRGAFLIYPRDVFSKRDRAPGTDMTQG